LPKTSLDWLGVVTLWLGALIMAIKAGGIPAPAGSPAFLSSDLWSFAPVVLVSVAGAIALQRALSPTVATPVARSTTRRNDTRPSGDRAPEGNTLALTASAPEVGTQKERTYVPQSFAERFLQMKRGHHTDLQVSALLRPHVGQWIRLTACFWTASPAGTGVLVFLSQSNASYDHVFRVMFDANWEAHLALLTPRSEITFDSQIVENHSTVEMAHSELL